MVPGVRHDLTAAANAPVDAPTSGAEVGRLVAERDPQQDVIVDDDVSLRARR